MNQSSKTLAKAWRLEWDRIGRGGVVIVFDKEIAGWMNELRSPDHWVPGCIAIDENGRTWKAVGGTERDGAQSWMPDTIRGSSDSA
jgi:hypothetical protein